jgi:iron complex transport system substrate-binding protein
MVAIAMAAAGCGAIGGPSRGAGTSSGFSCAGPSTAKASGWVTPITRHPTQKLPVTVKDFSGQPVTISTTRRILALDTYGTLAATVYGLGLGDRLVGRDISTGIPALRHLPVVTHNGHELDAEAILELNPSVILTDYSIGPLEVQMQLRDAGIPVVIMDDTRSVATIDPQIRAVAQVLGVEAAGDKLAARTESQIDSARAAVTAMAPTGRADRPRMVFLYMRGNAGVYYWFGTGSGADTLIDALDGVDVATESGLDGYRPINAEGLVKAAPDLYLMMTDGLKSVGGVDGLMKVAGVAETTAGASRCVVDMRDDQILSFGPQFPVTLRALGQAIYGHRANTT